MGSTTAKQKCIIFCSLRYIEEKCSFGAFVKLDVQSALPICKRKRGVCCGSAFSHRSATYRYAIRDYISRLQTCFLQRYQAGFFVKRSVPFLCGEAMLGNYKRSCFKTGIPENLPKRALSLLAFFPPNFLLLFLWMFSRFA